MQGESNGFRACSTIGYDSGVVIIMTVDGNRPDTAGVLFAFNATTGEVSFQQAQLAKSC
jgi:outer membrane protein assembly factor BamB